MSFVLCNGPETFHVEIDGFYPCHVVVVYVSSFLRRYHNLQQNSRGTPEESERYCSVSGVPA